MSPSKTPSTENESRTLTTVPAPGAIQQEPRAARLEATMFDAIAEQLASKLLPLMQAKLSEQTNVQQRLFTVPEAAVYLGRTTSAVEHLIQENTITPVRIDRRVQIDRRDLDALINRSKETAV